MTDPASTIIGGMFGLDLDGPEVADDRHLLADPCLRLATARSAFTALVAHLTPQQVWLPSYLCDVIVNALRVSAVDLRFYGVDDDLRITDLGWLDAIRPGDLAIFIDYFGFRLWDDCAREARSRGAWVVEDACQALLNDHASRHAHYLVMSPRKFFGVPDGGLLRSFGAPLPAVPSAPAPAGWWLDALAASHLRAAFDQHGGARQWFERFQTVDAEAPVEPFRMSELTHLLLTHRIDIRGASARRRENYAFLVEPLHAFALFPELPADVVPLGFPVRLQHRNEVRRRLFAAQIFPPVHWPVPDLVPHTFVGSRRLAGEIMTLPCDQRYGMRQMQAIVHWFLNADPRPVRSSDRHVAPVREPS